MLSSLLSGAAGALALNAVHEAARRVLPRAPHVDRLGETLVARAAHAVGQSAPGEDGRYALALAGDLISNTVYYALVGAGEARRAPTRGALLGLTAGVGTVALPPLLGLPTAPVRRTAATAAMTVTWYALGGLVAGVTYRAVAA